MGAILSRALRRLFLKGRYFPERGGAIFTYVFVVHGGFCHGRHIFVTPTNCPATKQHWSAIALYVNSLFISEILLPRSFRRRLADELKTTRVSTAICSKDISVIYMCVFCILVRSGNLCCHTFLTSGTYRVAQKSISLQIFRKLHNRIARKLVDFCNIICWTQSLTFCLKNFIALWCHLAKTPLLSFIHTVQIDLSITQWLCFR